jgi:ABC-type nitrate/sulfonate/bicarbonate transport system ATPase subunit
MPALEVIDLHHGYPAPGGRLPVLDGVSLAAGAGEFVSIVGPSGGGKSTLLNLIAGLERPERGRILLDGAEITGRRGLVASMPQRDALLPWRSVLDNAVLPALVRGEDAAAARREAAALLDRFGLAGFGAALPAALSGGMRQRAALLRTVLWHRPVMLLDEPFGALDAVTRAHLQVWLQGLWDRLDRTILLVTHDIDEAILLSDRVYVLSGRPGRVELEVPIALPRPRDERVMAGAAFLDYRTLLRQQLLQGRLAGTEE